MSDPRETSFYVDPTKRSIVLPGLAADKFYNLAVRGYRRVDKDINASGVIFSELTRAKSWRYQPSTTVAFNGDVTGTIQGVSSLQVITDLHAITSDGVLSRPEKQQVVLAWSNLHSQMDAATSKANQLGGLDSFVASAAAALAALDTYLGQLAPAWNDLGKDTPVDPETFQNAFAAAQAQVADLIAMTVDRASQLANWTGVTGPGKPQDNATVGAPAGTKVGDVPVETVLGDIDNAKLTLRDTVIPALRDENGNIISAASIRGDIQSVRDTANGARSAADAAQRNLDQAVTDLGGEIDAAKKSAGDAAKAAGDTARDLSAEVQKTALIEGRTRDLESTVNDPVNGVTKTAARLQSGEFAKSSDLGSVAGRTDTIEARQSAMPVSFLAVARGLNAPNPSTRDAGIFDGSGKRLTGFGSHYNIVTFNSQNVMSELRVFNTLAVATDRAAMRDYLNSIPNGTTVVVFTYDEPATYRDVDGIAAAMDRIGAGPLWHSPNFQYRGAYVLIGRAGIGFGQGVETYAGSAVGGEGPADAVIEQPFDLIYGLAQLNGGGRGINEVTSRLNSTEFAKTTDQNAIAGRTSDLESAVGNGAAGGGIIARLNGTEFAKSDTVRAIADRTSSLETSVSGGSTINVNPTFSTWTDGGKPAQGWTHWPDASSGSYAPVGPNRPGSDHGVRFNTNGYRNAGWVQSLSLTPGWYVMEAEASLEAGTWFGAGLTVQGAYTIQFADEPDSNGDISSTKTGVRRWTKLVHIEQSLGAFHLMTNWEQINPQDKSLTWWRAAIRLASDAEVQGKKALDTATATKARIDNGEFASSSTVDAIARRTSSLETEVTGAGGVKARLNSDEFAKSTDVSGIAQRTRGLETSARASNNLLSNSALATTAGWNMITNPHGGQTELVINGAGDNWHPKGENALTIHVGGAPNGTGYVEVQSDDFAVTPGEYLQFYAYLANHRSDAWISIFCWDRDGGSFAYAGDNVNPIRDAGGNTLDRFNRFGVKSWQIPPNAAFARLVVRLFPLAGNNDPYVWCVRPYVGSATKDQAEWNPWSPTSSALVRDVNARLNSTEFAKSSTVDAIAGRTDRVEAKLNGSEDSQLKTSINDEVKARTDAINAMGSRTSSLEVASGRGAALNTNPAFLKKWDGSYAPDWYDWANGTRATHIDDVAGPRVGFNLGDEAQCGWAANGFGATGGWYVMEATIRHHSGDLRGAGLHCHLYEQNGAGTGVTANLDFTTDKDILGVVRGANGSPGGGQLRFSKLVFFDRNTIGGNCFHKLHMMANWEGFNGAMRAKNIDFLYAGIRPATQGEIIAQQASKDLGTAVARLDSNEFAKASNLDAVAKRTSTLEATRRGSANLIRKATFEDGGHGMWNPYDGSANFVIRPSDYSQSPPPNGMTRVLHLMGYRDNVEGSMDWNAEDTGWIKGDWSGRKLRVTTIASGEFSSAAGFAGVFAANANGQIIGYPCIQITNARQTGYETRTGIITMPEGTYGILPWVQNPGTPGQMMDMQVRLASYTLEDVNAAENVSATVHDELMTYVGPTGSVTSAIQRFTNQFSGAEGSQLKTDISNEVQSRINGDNAIASRTSYLEATGALSAGVLNPNPNFTAWPDGAPLPTYWNWWNAAGNQGVQRPSSENYPGWAIRMFCAANAECGIAQMDGNGPDMSPGWYVMEADVRLESGTWQGSGLTIQGQYNLDFARESDTSGSGANSTYIGRRRFTKLVHVTNGGLRNWHPMSNWSGFGQMDAKQIVWYRAAVRPATDGEIKAQAAKITADAMQARVDNNEFAKTTDQNAIAGRTASIEAKTGKSVNVLNNNPTFDQPGWANSIPPSWDGWANDNGAYLGPLPDNRIVNIYTGGKCLQIDRNGNNNGIHQSVNVRGGGWFVLEAVVTFEDGLHEGCGVHVNFRNGYSDVVHFGTDPDTGGSKGNLGNCTRSFSKLIWNGADCSGADMYLMAGWEGMATGKGFLRSIWHKAVLRPATQGEIDGRAARIDATATKARIDNNEFAKSSDTNAVAQRTSTLEARAAGGGNLLRNTEWNYTPFYDSWGSNVGLQLNGPDGNWTMEGQNILWASWGQPRGVWMQIYSDQLLPIKGGRYYQSSGLFACHRGELTVQLQFFDINKNYIANEPSSGWTAPGCGGRSFAPGSSAYDDGSGQGYSIKYAQGRAPDNAVYARWCLYVNHRDVGGDASTYVWIARPQLCEVSDDKSGYVPYTPGTGGAIGQFASKITTIEQTTAAIDGRTQAYIEKRASVPGASAAIIMKATNDQGQVTSDVALIAGKVALQSITGEVIKGGLTVQGSDTIIDGMLTATTGIKVGSGKLKVAIAPTDYAVSNDESVNFGFTFDRPPAISFGPCPVALGQSEVYRAYADVSTTGFTAHLVVDTAPQSTTQNTGVFTNMGGGVFEADASSKPKAANGEYTLAVSVYITNRAYAANQYQ